MRTGEGSLKEKRASVSRNPSPPIRSRNRESKAAIFKILYIFIYIIRHDKLTRNYRISHDKLTRNLPQRHGRDPFLRHPQPPDLRRRHSVRLSVVTTTGTRSLGG